MHQHPHLIGHVLKVTTRHGLFDRVWPPQRRGEGEVVSKEVSEEERGARGVVAPPVHGAEGQEERHLDRPGRLPHQQGLCEARLGYRAGSPQLLHLLYATPCSGCAIILIKTVPGNWKRPIIGAGGCCRGSDSEPPELALSRSLSSLRLSLSLYFRRRNGYLSRDPAWSFSRQVSIEV